MKRKSFLILILLLMALLLTFVACKGKKQSDIPVPQNLAVENNLLTWDAVTGALSYDVKLDDNVYTSDENKYTLPIKDYEEHEIAVRAKTYDGTGNYSAVITYKRPRQSTTLPQLSAPRISMTSNRVMWNTILNNDGYKIFFDGKTIVAPKNATYYDLTFTKDGRFEITMQTLGDGVSYASSTLSSPYSVTVKDGKAPLDSLPKVEFSFNATEKVIEWKNRYSADAVSYEIYRDNASAPVAVIPADATKTTLRYTPSLAGGKVSFTMRLVSNNGLYVASNFNEGLTFPIADAAPDGLVVAAETERNAYYIKWSARDYADGYVVDIDGVETQTAELSLKVPSSLTEGYHVVKVKTKGNGVYYADSLYSGGVSFYTQDSGKMQTPLATPVPSEILVTEDSITLRLPAVKNAASYDWRFVAASGTVVLTTQTEETVLTQTTFGDREASAAEQSAYEAIRAGLATGVTASVSAVPENALFVASPYSAEQMMASAELSPVLPPAGFTFDGKGISWMTASGTDYVYELDVDGVITERHAGESVSLSAGTHVARIRQKAQYALWSEEIFFRTPSVLSAPVGLAVNSGILTFTGSNNASGYVLYANGVEIGTLYPTESMVLLSSYIKTDGNYVLTLQAVSASGLIASPLSDECLYVKTDGEYGTAAKPFVPQSSAELLSLMRENDGAYFELVNGGVYNFSDYDFSAVSAFDFAGVLLGNGATLKGIRLSSSLFGSLNNATIRNLTIETQLVNYASAQGGVLAQNARSATFSDVTVKVSGNVTFSRAANFGVLFYKAEDLSLRNARLEYDISLNCGQNCLFGGVAYDLKGNLNTVELSGTASLRGSDVKFSGLGVVGNFNATGVTDSLAVTAKGTLSACVAGCTTDADLTAVGYVGSMTVSLDAPAALYYGVAAKDFSVAGAALGGVVQTTEGTDVALYGVGESATALTDVTVSTQLKGRSRTELRIAGLLGEIGEIDTANSAFTGRIETVAAAEAEVTAAACAFEMTGEHALRSACTIVVSGGNVEVTAGAIDVETLSLDSQSVIIADGADVLRIGGAAATASGTLTVTGSLELAVTDCIETYVGGVTEGGDQTLSINQYRVFGSVGADVARVGGVSYEGQSVVLSALDLTTDLTVTSADIKAAGALIGANALSVANDANINAVIRGVGGGKVAGFALGLGNLALTDLSVTGELSLQGAGAVYGVAQEAGAVSNVRSTASLTAEGGAILYGLFERTATATDLFFSDAAVNAHSDHVEFYGLVGSVSSGNVQGATLSNLQIVASPLAEGEGAAKLVGVTDRAKNVTGASVSGVTYTIGAFDTLTFGGLASYFSESAENGQLVYTLSSEAKNAVIGGAFTEGGGRINALSLGGTTPLTVVSSGSVRLGGLIADPGNVNLTRGSSYLNYTLSCAAAESVKAGGLFGVLSSSDLVTVSDHSVKLTAARSGAGEMSLGGIAAEIEGSLSGAVVEVDFTGGIASDVLGGIAAKTYSANLTNCLAKGKIVAQGKIGGLVGAFDGGSLSVAASTVTVTSQSEKVGGLFGTLRNASILSAYSLSRMTQKGYGLFAEGENTSMSFCYFAGEAHEYALAGSAESCLTSAIFLDATLNGIPAVQSGSLPCEYRSFGYGYVSSELGNAYVTDGARYPYLAALGYPIRNASAPAVITKPALNLSETLDLYTVLPRFYDAASPSVTWVDESGRLEITNGVATVVDNGSGVLYGVLAGGVRVYRAEYVSSGFVPFAGEGTEASPYLIENVKYLSHVKEYAAGRSDVFFKFVIEGGELENATLETTFTSTEPFRGTMDFNNVRFLSPTIGANGVLGYLNGATVKNLVLEEGSYPGWILSRRATGATVQNVTVSGTVSGECSLIGTLTDAVVTDVTVRLDCVSQTDFRCFTSVSGGSMENISLRVSVNSGEDVSVYLLGTTENVAVTKAQALLHAPIAGRLTTGLVNVDQNSAFTTVMFIADAPLCDAESEIAGFAFTAEGSHFENAVSLTAGEAIIYPIVKTGDATYTDVKVCSDAAVSATAGVTQLPVEGAKDAIALMSSYQSGVVFSPLGFDLLAGSGEPDYGFTLDKEELELTERLTLSSAFIVLAEQPLARMLSYSFTGAAAKIVDGVLRPIVNGSGTLTVRNFYGQEQNVAVTVVFDGFGTGEGTEEDPYVISSVEDLKRLSAISESAFYSLAGDVSGEIDEPLSFNGVLKGTGGTITIDLSCDSLFKEGRGRISGVNFVVRKDEVSFMGGGALFMSLADGLTVTDCAIRVECPSVTSDGEDAVGLLFGTMTGSSLENVTVTFAEVSVTAGGNVGLVAGLAENTFVKNLSVSGVASLTATGESSFGAFGNLRAQSKTYQKQVGENPEDYTEVFYVDGLTLSLTLTVAGSVSVGGAAGESNVTMTGVTGSVNLTLSGGSVFAGGAVGVMNGDLVSSSLSGSIGADVREGSFGGLIGALYGNVEESAADVHVTVTVAGEGFAGGAVGSGSGSVTGLTVTANVSVTSSADEALVASLLSSEDAYVPICAAGGAVGYLSGRISLASVTVASVSAATSYAGTDLYALAGGIAGYVRDVENVEVKGAGSVTASGGAPCASGGVALLGETMLCTVISGVTVTAESVGWAAVISAVREDGLVQNVFATIGTNSGALVTELVDGAQMEKCAYLYGADTFTEVTEGQVMETHRLGSLDAFYAAALYEDFDEAVWQISGEALPTLK